MAGDIKADRVCDVVCMQILPLCPVPFEEGTDVGGGRAGEGERRGKEETPLPSGASLELRQPRISNARTRVHVAVYEAHAYPLLHDETHI